MGLIDFLQKAAYAESKSEVAPSNPFTELGFDQELPRLGWARELDKESVIKALVKTERVLDGKEQFIFVGMGGSANGSKALATLGREKNIFVLDSLSALAWGKLLERIDNWQKVAVIAISKSGSTAETQHLAYTLRNVWDNSWQSHFLWLSDKHSFEKLRQAGWEDVEILPIQPDGREDIGGRFSSPQTLVFLLPLYLLFGRSQFALGDFIHSYLLEIGRLRQSALELAEKYRRNPPLFEITLPPSFTEGFSLWITQLFNESFGSKREGLPVKTLVGIESRLTDFSEIRLMPQEDKFLYLAQNMYFLEHFVAFYSYFQKINFVSQPFVERYKEAMKHIKGPLNLPPVMDLEGLKEAIAARIQASQRFVEIVLYFSPSKSLKRRLQETLSREFRDREVFIFEGSDWNHHSYQAAFGDQNTFYAFILCAQKVKVPSKFLPAFQKNEELLKKIAQATFDTLADKSIYLQLKEC